MFQHVPLLLGQPFFDFAERVLKLAASELPSKKSLSARCEGCISRTVNVKGKIRNSINTIEFTVLLNPMSWQSEDPCPHERNYEILDDLVLITKSVRGEPYSAFGLVVLGDNDDFIVPWLTPYSVRKTLERMPSAERMKWLKQNPLEYTEDTSE